MLNDDARGGGTPADAAPGEVAGLAGAATFGFVGAAKVTAAAFARGADFGVATGRSIQTAATTPSSARPTKT